MSNTTNKKNNTITSKITIASSNDKIIKIKFACNNNNNINNNESNNNKIKINNNNKPLGIRITEDIKSKKCFIENVKLNSIAEKKGIRNGDIIVIPNTIPTNATTAANIINNKAKENNDYIYANHKEILNCVHKFQNGIDDLTLFLKRNNTSNTTNSNLAADKISSSSPSNNKRKNVNNDDHGNNATTNNIDIRTKYKKQQPEVVVSNDIKSYYETNNNNNPQQQQQPSPQTQTPLPPSSSSQQQLMKKILNNIPDNKLNRILQRKKDISYGKNTIGYDEYIKKVPKHKRRLNSMITPMTPDPEEDMPARRWQGQVRAWRKALHRYDPPGHDDRLKPTLLDGNKDNANNDVPSSTSSYEGMLGKLESKELYEISKGGLPVEFNLNPSTTTSTTTFNEKKNNDTIDDMNNDDNNKDNDDNIFNEDDSDDDDDLL